MVHVQTAHMINIYELGSDATNHNHNNNNSAITNNNNSNSSNIVNVASDASAVANKLNGNANEKHDINMVDECTEQNVTNNGGVRTAAETAPSNHVCVKEKFTIRCGERREKKCAPRDVNELSFITLSFFVLSMCLSRFCRKQIALWMAWMTTATQLCIKCLPCRRFRWTKWNSMKLDRRRRRRAARRDRGSCRPHPHRPVSCEPWAL